MIQVPNTGKFNFYKKIYKTFGLGKITINKIFLNIGVNLKTRPRLLKKKQKIKTYRFLKNKRLGEKLKKFIRSSILYYITIRSCKGWRYTHNYPVRGQRTHTNAQTRRKARPFRY